MILVLLAAAAQAAAQPLPVSPTVPPPPLGAQGGMPHHPPRQQLFVAPSGEPFRAAPDAPYPVAVWFARANTTRDGKLTEAQFTADFIAFAATLDLDHDGTIDSAEVLNYETNILPEVHSPHFGGGRRAGAGGSDGHHGGESGGGGPERPQGAARFGLLPLPEPVAAMDPQQGGRITHQAVLDAAHIRFAQLDTAQHGYLLLSDLPKTWVQTRREMFRQHREQGGGGNFERRGGMGGGSGGGSGGGGGDFRGGSGGGGMGGGDEPGGSGDKDQGT